MLHRSSFAFFSSVLILGSAIAAGCSSDPQVEPKASSKSAGSGGGEITSSAATGGGGVGGETPDAGPDIGQPSDVYPAPHGPVPFVVNLGGPTLKAPKIYPVFFSNDDPAFTAKVADYVNQVGATEYWKANTQEYGIGAATGMPPIQLTETATGTIDDVDIQAMLTAKMNADDPAFPIPDANTLLALFYPSNVTITSGGSASCSSFGGYHTSVKLDAAHGGIDVAYAIMPRCPDFNGLTGIDVVTGAGSHEFLEAATDPYPQTMMPGPAYGQVDNGHLYWLFALGGGETGDMCAQSKGVFTTFPEMPDYVVQRSWSNKSAKASHDPCVPAPVGVPYFNATPVFNDQLQLGMGFNFKGAKIGLNETKVVDVQLWSDGPTNGPFTVEAFDFAQLMGQGKELDLAFDVDKGENGQTLHLSITVVKKSQYNAELFYLFSHKDGRESIWVGIVGQ